MLLANLQFCGWKESQRQRLMYIKEEHKTLMGLGDGAAIHQLNHRLAVPF